MILPAKHIPAERSLSGVGAQILGLLDEPRTVSEVWVQTKQQRLANGAPITFDWFVLAVSWLYTIAAIDYADGLLSRRRSV